MRNCVVFAETSKKKLDRFLTKLCGIFLTVATTKVDKHARKQFHFSKLSAYSLIIRTTKQSVIFAHSRDYVTVKCRPTSERSQIS